MTPFAIPPPAWPADYGVPENHCLEVFQGCYDVPYDPPSPPTVLDIGANVGAFALWAQKRWPGCAIHCYEPSPRNWPLLQRTLSGENVFLHNVAVSNHYAVQAVYRGTFNCGEDSIVLSYGEGDLGVAEVVGTSDLPRADVLKIDTEGSELEILSGLIRSRRMRNFQAVMLEAHSSRDVGVIADLMAGFDYRMTNERRWSNHRSEMCFVPDTRR